MAKTEVEVEESPAEVAFDWANFIRKPSEQVKMNFALLYGPPGGGKTYTAATASQVAELSPVLIIDTEGSTFGSLKEFDDENIDIIPVTNHEGFTLTLEAALAGELPRQYKTIIIDTFDVAYDRAKAHFESFAADNFKMWAMVKDWALDIANTFRTAEFFGIMVIHAKREVLESGRILDQIALAGSAKDIIPGIPDIVAYVERNDLVTTAWFEASHNRVSKNRHGLPEEMEDPSFEKVLEYVNNKKKED